MNFLRSFDNIKENIWGRSNEGNFIKISGPPIPSETEWDYGVNMEIENVKIWEQLHHDSGNFGLFVSWSPYVEFYILIYYPFINFKHGIRKFYGPDACFDIANELKKININFDIKKISIPTV